MQEYHCKSCFRRSERKDKIVESATQETIKQIKSLPWWKRLFNKFGTRPNNNP